MTHAIFQPAVRARVGELLQAHNISVVSGAPRARAEVPRYELSSERMRPYVMAHRAYTALDDAGRLHIALDRYRELQRRGNLPVEPSILSYSPFGVNAGLHLALWHNADLQLADATQPLSIALYGAGFHSDSEQFPQMAMHTRRPDRRVFGDLRGTSHQARELLALFLPGERAGSVTVYDADPRVAQDLQRAHLTPVNSYARAAQLSHANKFYDDYRDILLTDRAVKPYIAGQKLMRGMYDQYRAWRSEFSAAEWAKVEHHAVDFVTDVLPHEAQSFDLSLLLATLYFLPDPVVLPFLSQVVDRMRIGGILALDSALPEERAQRLGLSLVAHVDERSVGHGALIRTNLYRRVEETQFVRDHAWMVEAINNPDEEAM